LPGRSSRSHGRRESFLIGPAGHDLLTRSRRGQAKEVAGERERVELSPVVLPERAETRHHRSERPVLEHPSVPEAQGLQWPRQKSPNK